MQIVHNCISDCAARHHRTGAGTRCDTPATRLGPAQQAERLGIRPFGLASGRRQQHPNGSLARAIGLFAAPVPPWRETT